MRVFSFSLVVLALGFGCGDKSPQTGSDDTGTAADDGSTGDEGGDEGGEDDTGDEGGGDDTGDEGGDDTGTGEPIYGDITGDCGHLDSADFSSEDPQLLQTSIDFLDVGLDEDWFSEGGDEILEDGNLGGSSIYSEVLAYEVLSRCDGATLVYTDGEVPYEDEGGKKTDLVVTIDGATIGVSVTRAYGYPPEDPYTVEQARDLLDDKLADVQLSSDNVVDSEAWPKQILHVVAYAPEHAESIETAWADVDSAVKADTIVFVTVTEGDDDFVY